MNYVNVSINQGHTMNTPPEAAVERYLSPNSIDFYALQTLRGDRRAMSQYEGKGHIPFCLKDKLTEQDCLGFLNAAVLATFTARVPLAVLVNGRMAITEHLTRTAFDFPVKLCACEFRVVGAILNEFDKEFAGEALVQVLCAVISA